MRWYPRWGHSSVSLVPSGLTVISTITEGFTDDSTVVATTNGVYSWSSNSDWSRDGTLQMSSIVDVPGGIHIDTAGTFKYTSSNTWSLSVTESSVSPSSQFALSGSGTYDVSSDTHWTIQLTQSSLRLNNVFQGSSTGTVQLVGASSFTMLTTTKDASNAIILTTNDFIAWATTSSWASQGSIAVTSKISYYGKDTLDMSSSLQYGDNAYVVTLMATSGSSSQFLFYTSGVYVFTAQNDWIIRIDSSEVQVNYEVVANVVAAVGASYEIGKFSPNYHQHIYSLSFGDYKQGVEVAPPANPTDFPVYPSADSILLAVNNFDYSYVPHTTDDDEAASTYYELATLFGSYWTWKEVQYVALQGGLDGTYASSGQQNMVFHFKEFYKSKEEWAANGACDYDMSTGMIADANMEITFQGETKWAMNTAWDMQMQPYLPTYSPSKKSGSSSASSADDDSLFSGKGSATSISLVAIACILSIVIAGAAFWYVNKGGGNDPAAASAAAPATELVKNPAHSVDVSGAGNI